ncbi:MAG: dTDP-4-dehydrorhamnose reductase [Myxococcota bacterium]
MAEFLVTGAGGMLGRSWVERLGREGLPHVAAARSDLDITDDAQVANAVLPGTRFVINCAAWTDVDGAESNPEGADRVNGFAVGTLAGRCEEVGATLVHYSTDYVFAGDATSPYPTQEARAPLNVYGQTKGHGESVLEASGADHLLIRSSWLYAKWGKNFVMTMRDLVQSRPSLRVVDDQRGRPSSCDHIASASLALLRNGERGIFHVCDGGECTWFDLASHIRDAVGSSCHIDPCTTEEFPRPAPRPAYSVLDLSKTEQVLGPTEDWRARVTALLVEAR